MTLMERAQCYNRAFAQWPASHLSVVQEQCRDVIYGIWLLGNNYKNQTPLYGAYPPGYLSRVMMLFPEATSPVLHVFSGSLPADPDYLRVDINPKRRPDIVSDVCHLPALWTAQQRPRPFLTMADPPYSAEDAVRYETPMVDRRRALASLAQIAAPGGFLVWLDTCWPMHRKDTWVTVGRIPLLEDPAGEDQAIEDDWQTVGRIPLVRSTNHRVRLISIFQRQPS